MVDDIKEYAESLYTDEEFQPVSYTHLDVYKRQDQGGIVVDVAVENSLYGELRGNLNLASRCV